MNIDIVSCRVERSSDSCIRIALKQEHGSYKDNETFFCISDKEWKYVRACMLGISDIYPYWDDCSYLLRFTPNGLRVAYTDYKECDYFTFPTNELVEYIDYCFNDENRGDKWRNNPAYLIKNDYTQDILKWKLKYGPNIKINIEDKVKERMLKDIQSDLLACKADNLIERLKVWASNYSNGNLIEVNIVFDSGYHAETNPDIPTSYYWWLFDPEEKVTIYNGGYIAHEHDGKYEYSIHT